MGAVKSPFSPTMARSWLRAPSEITILNLPASILLTKGESSIYIIEGNEKKGVIERTKGLYSLGSIAANIFDQVK